MILDPRSIHPSLRSYVLKLRRDAAPERERIAGRVEHMASGRCHEFANADEPLACLATEVSLTRITAQENT